MPDPAYLSGPGRPRRPNIMARHHVVVSGHYYASLAGLQILEAGGNAIDAGVATGLAIDVLESQFVGFGGVAPVMIHLAEHGETLVINGIGVWPKAAHIEHFQQKCGGRIPEGLLQTVVPAAPANWIAALERFGTMSFGDVAASAIRFARDGFPTYPFFAEILAARQAEIRKWPTTAAIFLPNGHPPAVGEIFRQADLGRTLQYMADQEKAHARGDRAVGLHAAHDAFYRGDITGAIVRHQKEHGGWLVAEDLAEFRSRVEPPCRIRFCDFDVYGCGPWSQGPMVLEALNIVESLDLKSMRHNSTAYVHAVTEALKLAAADREVYFGDPDFVDVPIDVLLSKDYATRRRAELDPAGRGQACRRRVRSAACRSRPGAPIRPPARRWRSPTPSLRRRSCVSPTGTATCSPPRRAIPRLAGPSCRAPASCRRCGARAVTPARIIRRASVLAGVPACQPIRRLRSSQVRW